MLSLNSDISTRHDHMDTVLGTLLSRRQSGYEVGGHLVHWVKIGTVIGSYLLDSNLLAKIEN